MAKSEETIKWPSYIGTSSRLDRAIKNIAEALLANRAEFLFGAGMSKTSGIAQGPDLSRMLIEEFFPLAGGKRPPEARLDDIVARYPLEALAETFLQTPGRTRDALTGKLKAFLQGNRDPDLSAHNLFLRICYWDGEDPKVYRVFTTNYETLLEDAFGGKGISITYENVGKLRDVLRGPDPRIPIIHLHGMLTGRYVISEADIFTLKHPRIVEEFENALREADAFVFVGYSMSDPDLRNVYMEYHAELLERNSEKDVDKEVTYLVSPPKDKSDYEIGEEIWKSRGVVWIPLNAATFFTALSRFLECESGTKWLDHLYTVYDIEDEKVLTQKVDRIANVLCLSQEDAIDFMMEARTRSGARR